MGWFKSQRKEIEAMIKLLGGYVYDPKCDFVNGGGYYQLTAESVRQFDNLFTEAIKKYEPRLFQEFADKNLTFNIKTYLVGRWLDDNSSAFYTVLLLRLNVDDQFRRWGQIYYANNPDKAKNVKLGEFL